MMDLLLRRRMMMAKASDGPPYHGYNIYGSPTIINGTSMLPTTGGYIYTTVPFEPGDASWEIHTMLTRNGTPNAGELFCTVDEDGVFSMGLMWHWIKSGSSLNARLYASSDGESWDLWNAYQVTSMFLSSGSWTQRMVRNGDTYTFYRNTTNRTATLNTPPLLGSYIAFGGGYSANGINCIFDLSQTYINVNGRLYWSAI